LVVFYYYLVRSLAKDEEDESAEDELGMFVQMMLRERGNETGRVPSGNPTIVHLRLAPWATHFDRMTT
jgi:hypothetical protein